MWLFTTVKAQPYGNEWIDYSKTYYKFKLAKTSIYRIPYSVLISAGMSPAVLKGTSFKLFRNGQEVPLYVTTNNQFSSSDYIEFYGEMNDGKPDSLLYKTPSDQPSTVKSLFTDSATFFLTLDPFSINARMQQQNNDISFTPTPEQYCFYTSYAYTGPATQTNVLNRGFPVAPFLPQLYNSDFDPGEGWCIGPFDNTGYTGVYNDVLNNGGWVSFKKLYQDPAVNATFTFAVLSNDGVHRLRTIINGKIDTIQNYLGPIVKRDIYQIGSQFLNESGNAIQLYELNNGSGIANTLLSVVMVYPRKFSFENRSSAIFSIKKPDDLYFEVKDFNTVSTTPILYDIKNKQRYLGVVDSVLKFHLTATVLNKESLYLSAQDANSIPNINLLTPISFTNFLNASQQGNYLIISNKKLKNSSNGIDNVEEYRKYRSSIQGGGYNAKVYYIDELNDQFGYGIVQHPLAIRNFINFAYDKFATRPQLLYIIGKGFEYNYNLGNQNNINRSLVQTYGEPASDVLLTARSGALNYPQIGVGRLAAITGDDVRLYLDKVKEYESILNDTFCVSETPFNKLWMKNVLHLGGGNTNFEQQQFRGYLDNYKAVIEAPKFGANVSGLFKNSTDPIQIAQNIFLDSLINTGVSLITFFGHSATTTTDFNLDPDHMDNKGKYHLMLSNGCFVGSIFVDFRSLSERFVLTPNKAAIGYVAPVTYATAGI